MGRVRSHLDDKLTGLVTFVRTCSPLLADHITETCFFAGGCIRDLHKDLKPNDYDLFFSSAEARDMFLIHVMGDTLLRGYFKSYNANRTFTINWKGDKFQFVTLVTGSPSDVINTFDFNINQNYYYPHKEDYYLQPANIQISFPDLIVNAKCHNPYSAMARVGEFLKRGYKIDSTQLVKLAWLCSQSKVNTLEELRIQLKGGMSGIFLYDEDFDTEAKSLKSADLSF